MDCLDPDFLIKVLEKSPQGIIILSQDTRILFWNRWMEKTSRLAFKEVEGRVFIEVFPELASSRITKGIAITSTPDTGTTFRLSIPQTMSIVPVLLVRSHTGLFAIPQAGVVELLSFYGDEVRENIEGKMQSPMVRVRGTLAPVVRLEEALRFSQNRHPENSFFNLRSRKECHIVVLHTEEGDFGLEVDRIEEPASLVVKPVIRLFSTISILAGTAVMPDGTISFLLNVAELAKTREPSHSH